VKLLGFEIKYKRTPVVFVLRFPSQHAAAEVSQVLQEDGFEVEVREGAAVVARRAIRADSLDAAERALAALAEAKGGRYEGARHDG
jgi:hypothetical protein